MNKEETEFHMTIVKWLQDNEVPFFEAIATLSYAIETDRSIPEAYVKTVRILNEMDAKDVG